MNKKILCLFLVIILMTSFFINSVYADEEVEEDVVETVQEEPNASLISSRETTTADKDNQVSKNQEERQGYIFAMFIVFLLILAVVTRKKSISSIISIISSVFILWITMFVGVKGGASIILMTLVCAVLIIFISHIITKGLGRSTYSAVIGSLAGAFVSGFLMFVLASIAKINIDFENLFLNQNVSNINVTEVLFATAVIASMEIIINITSNIVLRLDKVRSKNRDMEWEGLFKHGNKVGEDIALKSSKILLLTYVGNVLIFSLVYAKNQMNFTQIISSEIVSIMIVSALAGSLGMLASIPITSIAYALLNKHKTYYKQQSDNIVEGKRSLKI